MPSMQPDEFKSLFNTVFGSSGPNYYNINENKAEQLKLLEKQGIKEDTVDTFGANALHYAAQYGDMNLIKYLIYLGFKWNLDDNQGFSLLYYAIRAKNDAVIKGLGDLHLGFYLSNFSKHHIILYAESHYPKSLEFLKNHYNEAFYYGYFSEKSRNLIFNHPLKVLINIYLQSDLSSIIISYLEPEEYYRNLERELMTRNQILVPLLNYYIRHPQDNEVQAILNALFSDKKSGINNLEQQLNALLKQERHGSKPYSDALLQCRINIGETTKNKNITVSGECWNHLYGTIWELNRGGKLADQQSKKKVAILLCITMISLSILLFSLHLSMMGIAMITSGLGFSILVGFAHAFMPDASEEINASDYFNIEPAKKNFLLFSSPSSTASNVGTTNQQGTLLTPA